MSYAIRNDGQGYRAVDGPDDVTADEWFSEGAPPIPVLLPPSNEDLTALAKEKRNQLLATAANRMAPLQDAVDVARATDDEVTRLMLWKGYRIDLGRIEQQAGFPLDIDWPLSPDEVTAQ